MKTAQKTAGKAANRRTAKGSDRVADGEFVVAPKSNWKKRQTGADIQTDALLERLFPKEFKEFGGRLSLHVEIRKNGCLLARSDLPYDASGLAHLVRCRPSYAKTRVGRERVVTLG